MRAGLAVGVAVLAAGCFADQRSLQPLFTAEELVPVAGIEGTWLEDGKEALRVRTGDDGTYELVAIEDGRASEHPLLILLGRVGGTLYWDVTARPVEGEGCWNAHLLPVHSIARVRLDADQLEITPLRSEWVKQSLRDGTLQAPYVEVDGEPVLTGSTADLQRLVLEHAEDPEAFSDSLLLDRAQAR